MVVGHNNRESVRFVASSKAEGREGCPQIVVVGPTTVVVRVFSSVRTVVVQPVEHRDCQSCGREYKRLRLRRPGRCSPTTLRMPLE